MNFNWFLNIAVPRYIPITYLKVHTRLLSIVRSDSHLNEYCIFLMWLAWQIPLCKGHSDLMKFPSFIWNYLVASKKGLEISSYFCSLLRIYEIYEMKSFTISHYLNIFYCFYTVNDWMLGKYLLYLESWCCCKQNNEM